MQVVNAWKRQVILFLISQSITLFGTSLVQYAIMWHVTLETKSGLMMTLYILCAFVPTLLLSPFAGVWADRYPRKRLIMLSDSTIALFTLLLAIAFYLGVGSIWLLFAIAAIRALGMAVQAPATMAMIPQLVPKEELTRFNSIQASLQSLNYFVAPVVSGALMAWLPLGGIFLIDVVTAIIGTMTLAFLVKVRMHERDESATPRGYVDEMRSGFLYIRTRPYLIAFFTYLSLLLFWIAAPSFLTPIQVIRTFGENIWYLTAIEVAFSSGMILGGIVMATWGGFANRVHTMICAVATFGIFTMALGITPLFWLYLVWMILLGIALPMFNTAVNVLLQEKVEEHMLGRVFSVHTMVNSSMMPLGMVVLGPFADWVSIETLMVVTGILVMVQAAVMSSHKRFIAEGVPALKQGASGPEPVLR
jgi:DHA3 family macrolide efflux protein-like MFS transporter